MAKTGVLAGIAEKCQLRQNGFAVDSCQRTASPDPILDEWIHVARTYRQFQITTIGTGVTVRLPIGDEFYGSMADCVLGIVE